MDWRELGRRALEASYAGHPPTRWDLWAVAEMAARGGATLDTIRYETWMPGGDVRLTGAHFGLETGAKLVQLRWAVRIGDRLLLTPLGRRVADQFVSNQCEPLPRLGVVSSQPKKARTA